MNNSWDFAQVKLRTTKLHHKEMHVSKLFSCTNPFHSELYKINPHTNIYIYTKKGGNWKLLTPKANSFIKWSFTCMGGRSNWQCTTFAWQRAVLTVPIQPTLPHTLVKPTQLAAANTTSEQAVWHYKNLTITHTEARLSHPPSETFLWDEQSLNW